MSVPAQWNQFLQLQVFVFFVRPALVPAHRGVVISRFCMYIWKCTRGKRFGGLCFCVWGPALGPKPSKEAWVQHKRTLVQVLLDCSGGLGANMITSSLLIHKFLGFFLRRGCAQLCVFCDVAMLLPLFLQGGCLALKISEFFLFIV